jgi:hypothetical protein
MTAVEAAELQQRILDAYGVIVEPHMAKYVLRRLAQAGTALRELPVIGGNARTGVPVRMSIDPSRLVSPAGASVVS